jgi:hypothetical protein
MSSARTTFIVFGALTTLYWSPKDAVAHSASLSSAQLVKRSMLVMRTVRNAHSQSSVRVTGSMIGTKTSERLTANTSADCTGTRIASRYTYAIRAAIRGNVVIGKGVPHALNMHYIILSAGSNTGSHTRTVLWERDTSKRDRWHTVSTVVQEPAYAAFSAADVCPTDGVAFRVAQGMSHTHLDPPVRATNLGRAVWVIAGTVGRAASASPPVFLLTALPLDLTATRMPTRNVSTAMSSHIVGSSRPIRGTVHL